MFKGKVKSILSMALLLAVGFITVFGSAVYADAVLDLPSGCDRDATTGQVTCNGDDCTSILEYGCGDENAIYDILNFVASILTGGVVVAGTVGITICGITIMTASDNEAKIKKAKTRIVEIVIGVIAWVLIYVVIGFLSPNGASVLGG